MVIPTGNKKNSYQNWALFFMLSVVLVGLLVMAGWQFNIERLIYPISAVVGMNPFTSVSFILLGVSGWLLLQGSTKNIKYLAYALTSVVILISLFKLAADFFPSLPSVDHLLYPQKIMKNKVSGYKNSMALTTGVSFVLSGISVLLINYESPKKRIPSHYLSLVVVLFAFFSLLGYLFGAPEFYMFVSHFPMAVHTAASFVLLSLAVFLAHPGKGITKEFTLSASSTLAVRLLLSSAILFPVLLGVVRLYYIRNKLISSELSLTLFVSTLAVIFCLIIFYFLTQLNEKELHRREAEEKVRRSEAIFRTLVNSAKDYAIFMLDSAGNVITWNKGAENIKGYTEEEIKGRNMSVFYPPEDQAKHRSKEILRIAREKGGFETEGWRVRKDGSRFWADVIITPLYTSEGVLTGYSKIVRDVTENKKAGDILAGFNEELKKEVDKKTIELKEITGQLRHLSAYLQNAREEERKNIAREIHDELGQMLVGIKMDMVWLRKKIMPQDTVVEKRFESALELLNSTRQTMRRISTDLHPPLLSDLGLVAALTSLSKDFQERSGITVNFKTAEEIREIILKDDVQIGIYRIFQESLTNVAKHANATNVDASLEINEKQLVLTFTDNGTGFDVKKAAEKKTLGLIGIRERALMLSGTYNIYTTPYKGTSIHVSVPLK